MQCPKCGAEMRQIEKDTSSGREIREYLCDACGTSEIEDRGEALWKILSDAKQSSRTAPARRQFRIWDWFAAELK